MLDEPLEFFGRPIHLANESGIACLATESSDEFIDVVGIAGVNVAEGGVFGWKG